MPLMTLEEVFAPITSGFTRPPRPNHFSPNSMDIHHTKKGTRGRVASVQMNGYRKPGNSKKRLAKLTGKNRM